MFGDWDLDIDCRKWTIVDSVPKTEALLPDVDALLARGFRWLRFPEPIEGRFEQDLGPQRGRRAAILLIIITAAYCIQYGRDRILMPDVAQLSFWWHFGLVVPLSAVVFFALLRGRVPVWLREGIPAVLSVLVLLGFLVVDINTEKPVAAFVHYDVIVVLVYINVFQRLYFRYALAATLISVALYAGLVPQVQGFPAEAVAGALFIMVVTAVLTLVANYDLEMQARRAYLLTLREKLRNNDLAVTNRELLMVANLDPLTGLANRRFLENFLDALWLRECTTTESVALLMIDIDHFKRLNDRHGHQSGDQCLIDVAAVIRGLLRRDADLAARYGGEEFLIVLPRADLAEGIRTGERIRRAIEARALGNAGSPLAVVTASVGVAAARPSTVARHADVIADADRALYAAKNAGRNRVWPPVVSFASAKSEATIQATSAAH